MRGPVHPLAANVDLGRAQAVALGWHKAWVELLGMEAVH
jgi:hypothetical protein